MEALPAEEVRSRLLELAAYLSSAARGNVDEAPGYGPFRLLEGTQRIIRVLANLGLSDKQLDLVAKDLTDNAMRVIGDPRLARQTADRVLALLAEHLAEMNE